MQQPAKHLTCIYGALHEIVDEASVKFSSVVLGENVGGNEDLLDALRIARLKNHGLNGWVHEAVVERDQRPAGKEVGERQTYVYALCTRAVFSHNQVIKLYALCTSHVPKHIQPTAAGR